MPGATGDTPNSHDDSAAPELVLPDYEGACVTNLVDVLVDDPDGAPDWVPDGVRGAQQVVLLTMPGSELSTVGLITRQSMQGLPKGLSALDDRVAVYLPMGYMIGGYTVFVPRSWTTPLDMSVEEAMRMALIAFMASGKGKVE